MQNDTINSTEQGDVILSAKIIEVSPQFNLSAKELEELDSVYPGAAEKIFSMAEKEQQARHLAQAYALESLRKDSEAERGAEKRGQWMAFLFLWGNLIASVVLAFCGFTLPASILAGASAANVLNTIIIRTRK